LAMLTSMLLDTGAGEWDADQIAQRFESVGAEFSAQAGLDMAWLSLRSLTEPALFDKALTTMQTILTQPRFAVADFQREQGRLLAALQRREEQPAQQASLAFYRAIYGDHPYAHPAEGYPASVKALTPEDLRRFYQRYYVARNAIVVIVGQLSRAQAEQTADRLLSQLPAGETPPPLPEVPAPQPAQTRHIAFPSQQTHVLSGQPGIHRLDPDYFPLYVGNHILGGSGLVSKLFDEVREKRGLAYSIYSYFAPLKREGPFYMGLQTRNDQTEQALAVMRDTLQRFIAQGPTAKELDAAKKNITGGFVLRFDTNSELASYVAMIGFYQLPLDYLETFIANVQQVTASAIKDVFQRRIRPEWLQTVTVGDARAPQTPAQ